MESKLTHQELDVIGHALGVNVYHAKTSKKKKDKKIPKVFYRNYYCSSLNEDNYELLCSLKNKNLMVSNEKYGNIYFFVTDTGIELFKKEFTDYIL